MYKLTATIAFLLFTLMQFATSAHAAVTDCHTGCEVGLQDDGAHFYNKLTGVEEGVVPNVGTGNGVASTSEGYAIVTRQNSTNVWIIDVSATFNNPCSISLPITPVKSLIFGNYAYVTDGASDSVYRVDLDCTGYIAIAVGGNPYGITKDSTTLYILNSDDGTISTIVPPATAAITYSIGRTGVDFLVDLVYRLSNNKLYVTGLAGIYEVDLPLSSGTSVLWQALPGFSQGLSMNDNYLATNDSSSDVAYQIPFATPTTYDSIPCISCRSADLSDDTLFTTGGGSPDVGIKAWTLAGVAKPFSPLTTTNTWSSAYLAPFTPPAAVCQNGVQETGEECDQSDFGTSTCGSEGFDGGSLTCSASCTIVNTACTYVCGNNSAATTEECDGSDLKSQDCTTIGQGFTGGTLGCNAGSCTFDTSSCTVAPTCNDGNIDAGEDCDGANLDGADCQSEGYQGGTLSCTGGCAFDYSACHDCGNGTADTGEECDGADLNSEDCISQGYDGGTLSCSGCYFNTSSCVLDGCGNGVLDFGEACDDGNNVSSDGCSNVCQIENGWECSGTPSNCTQICGNGVVNAGEECDGSNLNNATCADFSGEGNLTCKSDCTLDTTGCLACNDPQLIYDITVNDMDQTQLKGHSAELFSSVTRDATEVSGDRISCGDYQVAGQTVPSVVVSLNAGEYKLVRISGNGFTSNCLFFSKTGPAKLYVSILDPKKTRIDNTSTEAGLVCIHEGEDVQFQVGGLLLGTLGTAFSLQYLTFNPKAQQAGEWAEVYVSTHGVNLAELNNPLNNGDLFVANFTDGPIYLNLKALADAISEIGRKLTDPEGCNCSTIEPGAAPIPILVLFFMLWSWRRSRQQSLQRVEFKSHRDR